MTDINDKLFADISNDLDKNKEKNPNTCKSKIHSNQSFHQPQLISNQTKSYNHRTLLKKLSSDSRATNSALEATDSKFSIFQNRLRNHHSPNKGNIFIQPFSPILSDDSSLLNEIIDSGIDVGIGSVNSPCNSSSQYTGPQSTSVAKIISDGGFTFMKEYEKRKKYQHKSATLASAEESSDEFYITKL